MYKFGIALVVAIGLFVLTSCQSIEDVYSSHGSEKEVADSIWVWGYCYNPYQNDSSSTNRVVCTLRDDSDSSDICSQETICNYWFRGYPAFFPRPASLAPIKTYIQTDHVRIRAYFELWNCDSTPYIEDSYNYYWGPTQGGDTICVTGEFF